MSFRWQFCNRIGCCSDPLLTVSSARFDVRRSDRLHYSVAIVTKVEFSETTKRIKFHFAKTSTCRDEWVEFGSDRIAPLGTKSAAKTEETVIPGSKKKSSKITKAVSKDDGGKLGIDSFDGMRQNDMAKSKEATFETKFCSVRDNEDVARQSITVQVSRDESVNENSALQLKIGKSNSVIADPPIESSFVHGGKCPISPPSNLASVFLLRISFTARFDVLRQGKSKYYVGVVKDIDFSAATKRVLFHFPKTHVKFDEWIEVGSPRICCLHTKVSIEKKPLNANPVEAVLSTKPKQPIPENYQRNGGLKCAQDAKSDIVPIQLVVQNDTSTSPTRLQMLADDSKIPSSVSASNHNITARSPDTPMSQQEKIVSHSSHTMRCDDDRARANDSLCPLTQNSESRCGGSDLIQTAEPHPVADLTPLRDQRFFLSNSANRYVASASGVEEISLSHPEVRNSAQITEESSYRASGSVVIGNQSRPMIMEKSVAQQATGVLSGYHRSTQEAKGNFGPTSNDAHFLQSDQSVVNRNTPDRLRVVSLNANVVTSEASSHEFANDGYNINRFPTSEAMGFQVGLQRQDWSPEANSVYSSSFGAAGDFRDSRESAPLNVFHDVSHPPRSASDGRSHDMPFQVGPPHRQHHFAGFPQRQSSEGQSNLNSELVFDKLLLLASASHGHRDEKVDGSAAWELPRLEISNPQNFASHPIDRRYVENPAPRSPYTCNQQSPSRENVFRRHVGGNVADSAHYGNGHIADDPSYNNIYIP